MKTLTPPPATPSVWFIHKTSCPECGARRGDPKRDADVCSRARQERFAAENGAPKK